MKSKKIRIYVLMAKKIKTRNCIQCKTHHTKMFLKFNKSIDDLINFLSQYIAYPKALEKNEPILVQNMEV